VLPLESGWVVLPLSGDAVEPEFDVPLVPVGFGFVRPLVPAPVVLEPVVLPVRVRERLRAVVDRDVPRRVAVVPGEQGTWSTAPFSFAATCPSAEVPVRSALALALALPDVFALVLPVALLVFPVALLVWPVVALPDVAAPVRRPRVVERPAVVDDGVHGVACAPVCAPDDVVVPVPCLVPWLERVDGVDGDWVDVLDPLPYCATAGAAIARLSATPPAHVMTFLFT